MTFKNYIAGPVTINRPWPSHLTSRSLTLSIGKISTLAALSSSEHCCEAKWCDVKTPGKLRGTGQTKGVIIGQISQVSAIMLTNKVIVISFCIHLRTSCFNQLGSCGMHGAKIYTKRKSLNLSVQNFMTWYYAVSGAPHWLLGLGRPLTLPSCKEGQTAQRAWLLAFPPTPAPSAILQHAQFPEKNYISQQQKKGF